MAWEWRWAGARRAGIGGGEVGCGRDHILSLSRVHLPWGCPGLFGVIHPPARRAYVPVPKNRVELVRPPVPGRRAGAELPQRGGAAGARRGACR